MKEQIEEIVKSLVKQSIYDSWECIDDEPFQTIINKEIDQIVALNDWLEYPKHKPSESGKIYVVALETGTISTSKFSEEQQKFLISPLAIAFKPIPVEPFVKKVSDIEMIDEVVKKLTVSVNMDGSYYYSKEINYLQELKAKMKMEI